MSDEQIPPIPPVPAAPNESVPNPGKRAGCLVGWLGLLFGISPILIGLTSVVWCGPGANEGNCAAAAAPWAMFFTIPVGFITGIVGIVVYFAANKKKK